MSRVGKGVVFNASRIGAGTPIRASSPHYRSQCKLHRNHVLTSESIHEIERAQFEMFTSIGVEKSRRKGVNQTLPLVYEKHQQFPTIFRYRCGLTLTHSFSIFLSLSLNGISNFADLALVQTMKRREEES